MALINKTVFLGVADRLAKQYSILNDSMASMAADGGGTYYSRISITGDHDVEIPLVQKVYDADDFLNGSNPARDAYAYLTPLTDLITGMESHFARISSLSSPTWDGYCADQDVRISEYTESIYFARKKRHMRARNVFKETEVVLASCEQTGASAITFTDGDTLGTGDGLQYAGEGYAGAQVKAVLTADVNSAVSIRLIGVSEIGESRTLDSGSIIVGPSGTEIPIPPASGRFVDLTDVQHLTGGTIGDTFEIVTIKEREVSL